MEARKHDSKLISTMQKQISLETRLKVLFQMEWLQTNIVPDREATDSEIKQANSWAKRMTKWVLKDIKRWQKDGAVLLNKQRKRCKTKSSAN